MNNVSLSGVINTKDIVLRKTPSGLLVTSFLLKVKREFKKNFESNGNAYDYIKIVCWSGMAELVVGQFKQGATVMVSGSLRTDNRELKNYDVYDKEGNKKENFQIPIVEVYAQHIEEVKK